MDRLLAEGHDVTALDDMVTGQSHWFRAHMDSLCFRFVQGDIPESSSPSNVDDWPKRRLPPGREYGYFEWLRADSTCSSRAAIS